MFAVEAKFIAKDFVEEVLPKVGEVGLVKQFFGERNVAFLVTEDWGNCVLAKPLA